MKSSGGVPMSKMTWKDTIDWRRVLNSLTKQELVEIILAHDMELIEPPASTHPLPPIILAQDMELIE